MIKEPLLRDIHPEGRAESSLLLRGTVQVVEIEIVDWEGAAKRLMRLLDIVATRAKGSQPTIRCEDLIRRYQRKCRIARFESQVDSGEPLFGVMGGHVPRLLVVVEHA